MGQIKISVKAAKALVSIKGYVNTNNSFVPVVEKKQNTSVFKKKSKKNKENVNLEKFGENVYRLKLD
jgi:hypothetical protein